MDRVAIIRLLIVAALLLAAVTGALPLGDPIDAPIPVT